MKRRTFVTQIITGTAALTSPAHYTFAQERRYLTEEQALKLVFPSSAKIVKEAKELSDEQLQAVQKALGVGETNGATDGYAMIANEIGKEQFITFIVGIAKEFKIQRVALMVFRESRGWEVADARFTGQFRGKTVRDRFLVGSDIIGITGATLSARAFGRGARKALVLCEALYKK